MADIVDCPVDFQSGVSKFGAFANAFRIVPEAGQECFIDFCVFSAQEQRAQVVARIRVHRSFLPIIEERLRSSMRELVPTSHPYVVKDGLLQTPDGHLVLFKTPPTGDKSGGEDT
jgi:hypothetical protein